MDEIEKEEKRLVEAFAEYAKKHGDSKTKEEGTEIIIPESDIVRFSIMGDFVSVSIAQGQLPEMCAIIAIDCYRITQKLRFTSHTPFQFEEDEWDL